MRKETIILIASCVVLTALAVVLSLLFGPSKKPSPAVSPDPISSSPTIGPVNHEETDTGANEATANPIVRILPHNTAFWSLDFDGSVGNQYRLLAIVYVPVGSDPAVVIAQQKPYIEKFVRDSGQPDGTYQIIYEPRTVDNSFRH